MENVLEVFRGYVKMIGERLKIEGLDLDEENNCYLAFDGKYFVKCSVNAEKEQLNFLAYIGALPEDAIRYYQGILDSCMFWKDTAGANISLDPEDGTLTLTQFCDMNMLNDDVFYKTLESFVNAMEYWDTDRREKWVNTPVEEEMTATAPSMMDTNMMMFGA